MSAGTVIEATLEAVAERHGDPKDVVYRELFKARPEFEELFVMDADGGVRASMLQTCFDCILDYCGDGRIAAGIISSERQHHEGYGVPVEGFDAFFSAVRSAVRSLLAANWTDAQEQAWEQMLKDFEGYA